MDSLVDSYVKHCVPCCVATPNPSREHLQITPVSQWSLGPRKHWLFWTCWSLCPYCNWGLKISWYWDRRLYICQNGDSLGKSNNDSPFNGGKFAHFAEYLGSKFWKVSPLWPKAHGEVEHFMRCLERFYSQLLTGSEICISYQATNVLLPIVLRVLLLPQPCLRGQLEPSYPTLLLCQAVKDMTHSG